MNRGRPSLHLYSLEIGACSELLRKARRARTFEQFKSSPRKKTQELPLLCKHSFPQVRSRGSRHSKLGERSVFV